MEDITPVGDISTQANKRDGVELMRGDRKRRGPDPWVRSLISELAPGNTVTRPQVVLETPELLPRPPRKEKRHMWR
ncbi:MAG: hypothetical protein AMXMBFR84_18580 [Candidatus Hydrogenedentota bacterium]